ncbi:sensor histidine kinase [Nocardia camponoti]|uniref:histidine kinase n=1 Tax=Nocardia camponoti TaxID=1616106 RepID=A0A917V6G8_9NOCA|nr:histidine kinase [Nocardia camponoti]GGK43813.1 hypothetical protein GCM10011591_14270 [Nocardia camponoti]
MEVDASGAVEQITAAPRPHGLLERLRAACRKPLASAQRRIEALPFDYPPGVIVAIDILLFTITLAAVIQRSSYFPTVLPLLAMLTAFLPIPLFAFFGVHPHLFLLKACGMVSTALFLLQPVTVDFAPFVLIIVVGEVAAISSLLHGFAFALLAIAELVAFDVAGKIGWPAVGARLDGLPMYVMGVLLGLAMGVMLQYQRRFLYQERENNAIRAAHVADEERRRIAREVHDVIAHSLSITLLHLTAARRALQTDDDVTEAVDALVDAERLGRQAMADIRRTVGMLETGAAASAVRPEPSAAELDDLVADFRRAGLRIDYRREGDLTLVDGAVGHALYRIGQESLANVAKHAPGADAAVVLVVSVDVATMTVTNSVAEPHPNSRKGTGMGLRGMRKRTELLGGVIHTGMADDGWTVRASFPLTAAASSCLPQFLLGFVRSSEEEKR